MKLPPRAATLLAAGGYLVLALLLLAPALPLALIGFELLPRPMPLNSAAVHPHYAALSGGAGAVLEVPPAAYKYVEPQRAQLIHGRPILGGYLARPPRYPWPNEIPGLRPLWKMRPEGATPFLEGSDGPIAALAAVGITSVVVRWDQIEPARRPEVEAALAEALPGLAPAYADTTLSAYDLTAVAPGAIAALSGEGWGQPEGDGVLRWRWMGAAGELVLINPGPHTRRFELALVAQSFQQPRDVALTLDGAPAGRWAVGRGPTSIRLSYWLAPGEHRLRLVAPTTPEASGGRALSIALLAARLDVAP